MKLIFKVDEHVTPSEAMSLLRRSETGRPDEDAHRLVRITPQANVVVTVRDGRTLVGLARGLKERGGCYLSDLIVDAHYRQQNVGEELIHQVRQAIGEKTLIVLVPPGSATLQPVDA